MKGLFSTLVIVFLAFAAESPIYAEDPAKTPAEAKDKPGFFEMISIARKVVGLKSDIEDAQKSTKELNETLRNIFATDPVDESGLPKLTAAAKLSNSNMVASLKALFDLISQIPAPPKESQRHSPQIKKDSFANHLQVPASFTAESIKKFRDMKAKNSEQYKAIDESKAFLIDDPSTTVKNYKEKTPDQRDAMMQKLEVATNKSWDLRIEEYRDMRKFLSAAEMKTYFQLQNQLDSADKALNQSAMKKDSKLKDKEKS